MQNIIIRGREVTYNFFPEEYHEISYGEFLIENSSSTSQKIKIIDCYVIEGDKKNRIDKFFIYNNNNEMGDTFYLSPETSMIIRVSFPIRKVIEERNKRYSVEIITVTEDGTTKAESKIMIEWEKRS